MRSVRSGGELPWGVAVVRNGSVGENLNFRNKLEVSPKHLGWSRATAAGHREGLSEIAFCGRI